MSIPIGRLRDGKPTGYLAEDRMEINVEAWTGKEWIHYGTKFVDMSEEVRAQVYRAPQVMSMEAVTSDNVKAAEQDLLTTEQKLLRAIGLDDGLPPVEVSTPLTNPEDTLPTNAGRTWIKGLPDGYVDATEGGLKPYTFGHSDGCVMSSTNVDSIDKLMAAFYQPGKEPETFKIMPAAVTSWPNPNEVPQPPLKGELENSGFNVNYYSIEVKSPKREGKAPYVFEVEDIIEAADLTFHEGNVLKSLIRSVNERNHGQQKKGSDYVRDAEKMVHSSSEELRRRKLRALEGKK